MRVRIFGGPNSAIDRARYLQAQRAPMRPKIGEPRVYVGEPEVIYPGEQATAEKGGEEPKLWAVEPSPGFAAALRRLRYRMIGQWLERLRERRQRG